MPSLIEIPYDRAKSISYANEWADKRNSIYYDFSSIGGDCTNFISQSIYAGCHVMNFTPLYGWYYRNINDRAAAWTSVKYMYQFLTTNKDVGPFGEKTNISSVEPGDLIQIHFFGKNNFSHTLIIVGIEGEEKTLETIRVASHTVDCYYRPLSTYKDVAEIRYIHINAARVEQQERIQKIK